VAFPGWTLRAGTLSDGQAPILRKLDQIIVEVDTDPPPPSPERWGIQFSPDGRTLAWSTRLTTDGKETLKVQDLNDPAASPQTVAEDVALSRVSRDGKKFYWLAHPAVSAAGNLSGVLQAALFPQGLEVISIREGVREFAEAGTGELIALADTGDLMAIPDRDQPR